MQRKPRAEKSLPAIGNLTAEECLKQKRALKAREGQAEGSVVLQKRAENITACPHCGSVSFRKWGCYNGKMHRVRSSISPARFHTNGSDHRDISKTALSIAGLPFARFRPCEPKPLHFADSISVCFDCQQTQLTLQWRGVRCHQRL